MSLAYEQLPDQAWLKGKEAREWLGVNPRQFNLLVHSGRIARGRRDLYRNHSSPFHRSRTPTKENKYQVGSLRGYLKQKGAADAQVEQQKAGLHGQVSEGARQC